MNKPPKSSKASPAFAPDWAGYRQGFEDGKSKAAEMLDAWERLIARQSALQLAPAAAEPMTPERAAYFMRRFLKDEKMLGPSEQAALRFVIALLARAAFQQSDEGPKCRDCADFGPICPSSGLPCGPADGPSS